MTNTSLFGLIGKSINVAGVALDNSTDVVENSFKSMGRASKAVYVTVDESANTLEAWATTQLPIMSAEILAEGLMEILESIQKIKNEKGFPKELALKLYPRYPEYVELIYSEPEPKPEPEQQA